MANVVRFTLLSRTEIFVPGVGLLPNGVFDVLQSDTSAVSAVRAALAVFSPVETVIDTSSAADPPVTLPDPYPQYVTDFDLATRLATVATTGAYADLTGKPTLGTAAAQNTTAFDPAGAAALARMGADTPIPSTGKYVAATGTGATAHGSGVARAYPITLGGTGTADRIGLEITTAVAASTVALGIYAHDTSTGLAGALILDAGTVDSSTTGFKEITISQALPAGTIWLAALPLGGSPSFRAVSATAPVVLPLFSQAEFSSATYGVTRTGQSSLPNPFAPIGTINNVARTYLRFA